MSSNLIEQAMDLAAYRRWDDALLLLESYIKLDPNNWYPWYLAGQCHNFLKNIESAIYCLEQASELERFNAHLFFALGIAYQQKSRWTEAVAAFHRAIQINPDYELAYNSLALTQKMAGELDMALRNYDAGVKALARRVGKAMENKRNSPIFKHQDSGELCAEYTIYAAVELARAADGIRGMTIPTGAQAIEEERTEQHGGLYWKDIYSKERDLIRLFLPNFFNTFREAFKLQPSYSTLIGNRGTVLDIMGRHEEAQQHFAEATAFQPYPQL